MSGKKKRVVKDLLSRVECGLHNLRESFGRNQMWWSQEKQRLEQEGLREYDPPEWVNLSDLCNFEDDVEPEPQWTLSEAWMKRSMVRFNDEHNCEKEDWDDKSRRAKEEGAWFDGNTGR